MATENAPSDTVAVEAEAAVPSKPNAIRVSTMKKPHYYYRVSADILKEHEELELSGLGFATTSVCSLSEELKAKGLVAVKSVSTSVVLSEKSGHKPQIIVVLTKGPDFDGVAADIEKNAPKAEEAPAAAPAAAAAAADEE